jgi:hypothetical protein
MSGSVECCGSSWWPVSSTPVCVFLPPPTLCFGGCIISPYTAVALLLLWGPCQRAEPRELVSLEPAPAFLQLLRARGRVRDGHCCMEGWSTTTHAPLSSSWLSSSCLIAATNEVKPYKEGPIKTNSSKPNDMKHNHETNSKKRLQNQEEGHGQIIL